MQSFNQALLQLYKEGVIDKEEALQNATSKSDLALMLKNHDSEKQSNLVGAQDGVIELKLK